jgi:hypothetical protein
MSGIGTFGGLRQNSVELGRQLLFFKESNPLCIRAINSIMVLLQQKQTEINRDYVWMLHPPLHLLLISIM